MTKMTQNDDDVRSQDLLTQLSYCVSKYLLNHFKSDFIHRA